ncbi:MAG: Holliday junction resolvase RuvX [Clostridia bacterium]|nr:Holliday junction resolvase RuvX [Clostridia bacterium]
MNCLLGIDYGDSRTGLAVAYGCGPALPLSVIDSSRGRKKAASDVAVIVADKHASVVVIGLPVNMDGSRGKRVAATEKFARALRDELTLRGITAEVTFWDERLTSKAAEAELRIMDRAPGRTGASDQIAAAIILDDYIAHLENADTAVESGADNDNG